MSTVLAVDGGNSKTDLAVVDLDGTVLAAIRGPGSSPHHVGVAGSVGRIGALYAQALATLPGSPLPEVGVFMLAGIDLDGEAEALHAALVAQGWVARAVVHNDTFAVLRSGTDDAAGVAVVCGAGINCVGVAADGRTARFPALGSITGDWGGGYDVGLGALGAAVRADDARGASTTLSRIVPEHFGLSSAEEVAIALHGRQLSGWRLTELTPLVFAEAEAGDAVAGALLDHLADEVAGFALAALNRLDMLRDEVDVVLGGGLLRAGSVRLDSRIDMLVHAQAPRARLVRATQPPVLGAAVLALDEAGADAAARHRLRVQFADGGVTVSPYAGTTEPDEPMRALDGRPTSA
jgi:N-acetylglucosamine kinase-like BadF-type ATPase